MCILNFLFPRCFLAKFLYVFLTYLTRAARPAHLILLDLIIPITHSQYLCFEQHTVPLLLKHSSFWKAIIDPTDLH